MMNVLGWSLGWKYDVVGVWNRGRGWFMSVCMGVRDVIVVVVVVVVVVILCEVFASLVQRASQR